jgi:hypothetical protein
MNKTQPPSIAVGSPAAMKVTTAQFVVGDEVPMRTVYLFVLFIQINKSRHTEHRISCAAVFPVFVVDISM